MTDDFQQGEILGGRYRVLGVLGRGGMATVYLAEDATLSRRVAIKVLHRRFADDDKFVERFRREAKAAAGLNHPNIVGVYDWGQIGAQNYIVMEYVDGETLKERIRRQGRLDGATAVGIALGLLDAIGAAHARGVVHRDVKSQNILLDAEGRVKVTDFGIAQAGDPSMTEAGSILGTAQYLAPEQARGESVDERSDLYSVGVVLYEMLTGSVPFKGDSAVTVALKHVNELPPEPAELVPGLPYALNQIVLKALAKDPGLRYANAAGFAADLRSAQAGGPIAAAAFDVGLERTQVLSRSGASTEQMTRVLTARDRAAARPANGRAAGRTGNGRGTPRSQPRRTPRWVWILVVLGIVALAVAGYFIYRAAFGASAQVPEVVGLNERTATARLTEAGFKVKSIDTYSDEYATGFVARQEPPAGTKLRKGGTVEIWVSRGTSTLDLPSFRGQTPEEVQTWLEQNGLEWEQKRGPSADIEKGLVYKQSPAAGEKVERGSTVTYWVSSGVAQVEVPNVVGMSSSDAEAALQQAGLTLGSATQQTSTSAPAGVVIGQDPGAGEKVDKGSAVNIVISSGSPTPTPTVTMIAVPGVLGSDEATATAILQAAGFVVDPVYQPGPEPAGTVVAQSPAGGALREQGDTVTITVDND